MSLLLALQRWNKPPQGSRAFVLPLECKVAHNVTDLLVQHVDQLEQEALDKGGIQQLLAEDFAKVYKVSLPLEAVS